jgi:hypothetical protein
LIFLTPNSASQGTQVGLFRFAEKMKSPSMTVTHHQNLSTQHQQPSPFHPEATAVPELGDFRYSENVVTTIELSDLYAMKIEHNNDQEHPAFNKMHTEPTVAVIPPEDILPMSHQKKIGGGTFVDGRGIFLQEMSRS